VLKTKFQRKWMLLILVMAGTALSQPAQDGRFPQRGRGQGDSGRSDGRGWSDRDKQERIDRLSKTLAYQAGLPDPGPEIAFIHARATELLERTKQVRSNNFQFDRLARAADALLRASYDILGARKAETHEADGKRRIALSDDFEKRDAAEFLQRCYFRIQQADYFARLSGEKESKKYVTTARSLYQQARSAYDALVYDKARVLGDAASMIVMALENIAHASLNIPDPPIIK